MFGITTEMLFTFLIRALVLFTAMPVHECAHGFVADRLGDDTPRAQGRLTLNPFVHLDLMGSMILFFTGFGWAKPVEVDMRNFKNPRRDMAITALAGPVSNIIMALLTLIAYKFFLGFLPSVRQAAQLSALSMVFWVVIVTNISLAVFNLLPVPPLDGSKIFGTVLPPDAYWWMMRNQRQISMIFMLLLVFGVLQFPISFLSQYVLAGLDLLTKPIDLLFR